MSDQPDKLFREKLWGHQRTVSAGAWSRVSANVNGRRKLLWWRSAAAAITLLCAAGVAIYPLTRKSQSEISKPAADAASPIVAPFPDGKQHPAKEEHKPDVTPPVLSEAAPSKKQTAKKTAPSPLPVQQKSINTAGDLPVIEASDPEVISGFGKMPHASVAQSDETIDHSGRKHVTIVFSAAEVNEKYLSKVQKPHATSDDQESSRLENILDKAYDLTHNQDLIGDLRQKKNEILAMNFRKSRPDTANE